MRWGPIKYHLCWVWCCAFRSRLLNCSMGCEDGAMYAYPRRASWGNIEHAIQLLVRCMHQRLDRSHLQGETGRFYTLEDFALSMWKYGAVTRRLGCVEGIGEKGPPQGGKTFSFCLPPHLPRYPTVTVSCSHSHLPPCPHAPMSPWNLLRTEVWDVASGRPIHTLRGHDDEILDVSFNATGSKIVTASADWTSRVFNTITGACQAVFHGHRGEISKVTEVYCYNAQ